MDAVEFIKTRAKMCKNLSCEQCPLKFFCYSSFFDQVEIVEDAVSVVEQWAKEHPVKTRQSELLKLFPNTKIDNAGTLCICPINFDPETYKGENKCFCIHTYDDIQCDECRHNFWIKEIK